MGRLVYLLESLRRNVLAEAQVADEPGIERIIDTNTWNGDVPGAGDVRGGVLTSYHVTDDPKAAIKVLRSKRNVVKAYGPKGRHAELGPGFYMSGSPRFWLSRSKEKWSFLGRLTKDQLVKLASEIRGKLQDMRSTHYVSQGEFENGIRHTNNAVELNSPSGLLTLAGQPYNIPIWKPDFLKPLGIKPGGEPAVLAVKMKGRFAWLKREFNDAVLFRKLKRAGVAGAFVSAGFSSNPQLVLWNPRAVVGVKLVKA